jgi:Ca2+:H+ antiporter
VARRLLWASLALAPATILVHYLVHPGQTVDFILAAAALIPLAWLIGEATEHAAHHTGPQIGGLLNATFGNAPELIIALFAINAAEFEVVRGSLSGSVVGNLLLVLGFSLVFGGRGQLDRRSSFLSLGLVGLATLVFLIPAIPSWTGHDPEAHSIARLSLIPAILLLVLYVPLTYVTLRRNRRLHVAEDSADTGAWPFRTSLIALGIATVATALIAEILVHAIGVFADKVGVSEFFLAAVVVAIVGNAAEHGGAVIVAYRGKIKLAAEIALASSAQVAVFLIPAAVLLSWLIRPLALSFRPVEIAALAGSTLLAAVVLADGRSSRLKGSLLIVGYVGAAVGFLVAGDR